MTRNRIVDNRMLPLAGISANALNWRTHPEAQRAALTEAIDDVGVVQACVVNIRSAASGWPDGEGPTLIDGHLRYELAVARGEEEIPCTMVDLSPEEERLVLLTLDPITGLAETDWGILSKLIEQVPEERLGGSLAALVNSIRAPFATQQKPQDQWTDMPEFVQKDLAFRSIIVHFRSEEDVAAFAQLVGQDISEKAKFIWHPVMERESYGSTSAEETALPDLHSEQE